MRKDYGKRGKGDSPEWHEDSRKWFRGIHHIWIWARANAGGHQILAA
jgi:hypothetical protein